MLASLVTAISLAASSPMGVICAHKYRTSASTSHPSAPEIAALV